MGEFMGKKITVDLLKELVLHGVGKAKAFAAHLLHVFIRESAIQAGSYIFRQVAIKIFMIPIRKIMNINKKLGLPPETIYDDLAEVGL